MFDTLKIPNMPDDEVRRELATCEPGSRVYILLSDEIHRRSLERTGRSSVRIEKLTWLLVVLTIVLIVLAAPPAWHSVTAMISN